MEKKPVNKLALMSPLLVIVGLVIAILFTKIEIRGVDTYFPITSIIQLSGVFFFSLLAFLIGLIAVFKLRKQNGEQRGMGLAIIGLLAGVLGMFAAFTLFTLLIGLI